MKINFLHLLTLIFVVAKIWGMVTWSWWLVFTPMIINFVLVVLVKLGETK